MTIERMNQSTNGDEEMKDEGGISLLFASLASCFHSWGSGLWSQAVATQRCCASSLHMYASTIVGECMFLSAHLVYPGGLEAPGKGVYGWER